MITPVLLCGGSGTRLWPLSREAYPKQFLPLVGDHTLLQSTLLRMDGVEQASSQAVELADPLVVCNTDHRFLVAEQMRLLGRSPASIILEPVGRNTAPALAIPRLTCRCLSPMTTA